MAYAVDTSGDWDIVEGLEDVLFFSLIAEGGTYEAGIATKGKMMPLSKKEIEMGDAQLITYGTIWHLWRTLLNGRIPKYGDYIQQVSTGQKFQINPSVDVVSLGNRFRCITMRMLNTGVSGP